MSGCARKMSRLMRPDGIDVLDPWQRSHERRIDRDEVCLLARLERADVGIQPERARTVERPQPEPGERPQGVGLVTGQRSPRHLGVRADPHDREDRGIRTARHVRPEPDRQARPRAGRTAA